MDHLALGAIVFSVAAAAAGAARYIRVAFGRMCRKLLCDAISAALNAYNKEKND